MNVSNDETLPREFDPATFERCATEFIRLRSAEWKNAKRSAQLENSLRRYAFPLLGALNLNDIEVAHIFQILEPIWLSKTETAIRVRARIEDVFDWARVSKLRHGENPAQWRGCLDQLLPAVPKSRVRKHNFLPFEHIGEFVTSLRRSKSPAATALEFLILTVVPTVAAIGAKRSEFNFADRAWTVPSIRTKNRRVHRIPLSKRAIEIALERIGRAQSNSDFLFPGSTPSKSMSNGAMLMLLRRLDRSNLTIDGFRYTFAEWAKGVVSQDLIDQALGLPSYESVAPGQDSFFSRRRELMNQWNAYVERKVLEYLDRPSDPSEQKPANASG